MSETPPDHQSEFGSPEGNESRVRISMGRRSSRVRSTMGRRAMGATTPTAPLQPVDSETPHRSTKSEIITKALRLSERVSGLSELSNKQAIDRAKAKLDTAGIRAYVEKYGGYRYVLGGNIREFTSDGSRVHTSRARAGREYDTKMHGQVIGAGMAIPWETGVNVQELVKKQPNDRFKFYLSLDTNTAVQQEDAIKFLQAVHKKSREAGIAMLTKSEDHTYDSCDIFTWSPVEMACILSELYDDYPRIWNSTEHPMQGEIAGIDPMHIGFAHEPINGLNGNAHSARMGKLGAALDAGASFEEACMAASVLPESPWIIDPDVLAA